VVREGRERVSEERQGNMSPPRHDWSDAEQREFADALEFILSLLSWDAAARVVGVSTATLANWQTGKHSPRPDRRERVLAVAAHLKKL
jgi:hypothetical protein